MEEMEKHKSLENVVSEIIPERNLNIKTLEIHLPIYK